MYTGQENLMYTRREIVYTHEGKFDVHREVDLMYTRKAIWCTQGGRERQRERWERERERWEREREREREIERGWERERARVCAVLRARACVCVCVRVRVCVCVHARSQVWLTKNLWHVSEKTSSYASPICSSPSFCWLKGKQRLSLREGFGILKQVSFAWCKVTALHVAWPCCVSSFLQRLRDPVRGL